MAVNDPNDPEMPALLARIEQYRLSYNFDPDSIKPDGIEDLYKTDDDFTAFDIAPPLGGYKGWAAYAGGWQHVMNKYREIRFTFRDDLRVFRRGDVAWSSFSADWCGKTAAGADFAKEIRMSMVWVKDGGKWRVTHEHGSSPKNTTMANGEVI